MKKRFLLTACLFAAVSGPGGLHAAAISFEEGEGFVADTDVAAQPAWKQSTAGAAKISDVEAQTGRQSLEIAASNGEAAATTTFPVPEDGIIFLDFAILPTADDSKIPLSTIDANGAMIGFLQSAGQGRVVALTAPGDKGAANIVDAGHPFAVDEQDIARDWMRLTIRENLKAGKWDLYVDGRLTLIDQPLLGEAHGKNGVLSFEASPAGSAYTDDLAITTINPLFVDSDKDGIPDSVEKANSYLFGADDRNGDANHNGISNIEEFRRNGKPAKGALAVLYVDNTIGNDANSGALPYSSGEDGPVKTLLAAFQRADDATTVAILPSITPYDWPSSVPSHLKQINTFPLEAINTK